MPRWRSAAAVSVGTLVAAAGCGGALDEGGGAGGVPFEAYGRAFAEAFCDGVSGCCEAHDRSLVGDRELCVQQLASRYVDFAPLRERVDYDGAAAARCMERMRTAIAVCDVDMMFAWPPCDDIFRGRVAPGGACARDEECAGPADGVVQCWGEQCWVWPARELGEACDDECHYDEGGPEGCRRCRRDQGHYCSAEGVCATALVEGSTCRGAYGECAPGLLCRPTEPDDLETHCLPPLALGAACAPSVQGTCADSYCDWEGHTCTPLLPDGAECFTGTECQSQDCNLNGGGTYGLCVSGIPSSILHNCTP